MKKIKALAVIQARVDSTRLPSKALLPLAGKPLIQHVIERTKNINNSCQVILATGEFSANYLLGEIAERSGIDIFYGPSENVLERYFLAAEKYEGDYIIRVTGDNPFTDSHFGALTLERAVYDNADLCAPSGLPLGTAVEVIKRTALIKCRDQSLKSHHFEHVTPFIKENQNIFKIVRFQADFPSDVEELRLTVDTREDYELAKYIYNNLPVDVSTGLNHIRELYLRDRNAFMINREIEQRPMSHSS